MEQPTGRTRLLKFWAEWCSPCRYMAPLVEGVLKDSVYSDVELVSVNIDDENGQETAREFNIRNIPTFVLLNNKDQVVNTLVGTASVDQVREFLSKR